MGVQRVSKKDLIDEYLYRPPSPKQKKKLTKKSWRKSKKTKVDIWALSFCINHLNICITIADFDITESGVLIWFSWVLKSTISPLKKCKILTLRGNISETEQNEPQKNYCWLCVTHQTEHFWKHRKNFTRYVLGPKKSKSRHFGWAEVQWATFRARPGFNFPRK